MIEQLIDIEAKSALAWLSLCQVASRCMFSQFNQSLQSGQIHQRRHCGPPVRAAVPASGCLQVAQQLLALLRIQHISKPTPQGV